MVLGHLLSMLPRPRTNVLCSRGSKQIAKCLIRKIRTYAALNSRDLFFGRSRGGRFFCLRRRIPVHDWIDRNPGMGDRARGSTDDGDNERSIGLPPKGIGGNRDLITTAKLLTRPTRCAHHTIVFVWFRDAFSSVNSNTTFQ